jgi:hypothetical protein
MQTYEKHTAPTFKAARTLATRLYGRKAKLYFMGIECQSIQVRDADDNTVAYIHLAQAARV